MKANQIIGNGWLRIAARATSADDDERERELEKKAAAESREQNDRAVAGLLLAYNSKEKSCRYLCILVVERSSSTHKYICFTSEVDFTIKLNFYFQKE